MNQFDQTVGGGITSLLAQNQEVMGEPGGAFNFAPKNEPVLKMADGGMTFSDDQVAQAIRESMAQGFTLDQSIQGAANKFGVPQDQLSRVSGSFAEANPANLIQQLNLKTPDFAKGFDFSQIGKRPDEAGEVIQGPSTQFGGYDVRALGQFADVGEGSYAPTGALGGYEATKSEVQANGKPLISTLKYDPSGALTGSTVRAYEGSDSGTEYTLDATGKVVGSRKFDESEAWKTTAAALLPMATMAFAPGLSSYFAGLAGAGAAGATASEIALAKAIGAGATGALVGGTGAALSGKEGSDLLRAAALGGITSAAGAGLGSTAGKMAGDFAGNLFTDPDLASIATQATRGAVESGIKALPGAIATGDTGRLLSGALTGGAFGAASSLAGDVDLPFTKQQAEAGINLVRAVNSGNLMSAANAAATLINNPDVTVATRAATLLKAVQSGNPNAIMAAAQMLGNTVGQSSKSTTKVAEAPGGAFETSAIIDEFGDTGGTLVPGEGGDELVNIFGTRSPDDIALDYFFSPEDTTADQKVKVQDTTIKPDELGDLINLIDKDLVGQRVDVKDTKIKPDELGPLVELIDKDLVGQRVDVTDKTIKTDEIDPFVELFDKDLVDQRVGVTGKKYIPRRVEGGEGVGDITDQKVEVTDKKYIPRRVDGGEGVAATTTTTVKPITTTTTTYETPTYTPMQEAAPAQPFRPGVVTDAYEVLFGPGAPSLMGFTKAERAKQMLARGQEEGENQPQTAYDHLMSMAEKDPVGTVDRLMKIIEGD